MSDISAVFSQKLTTGAKILADNVTNIVKDGVGKLSDAAKSLAGAGGLSFKSAFEKKDLPKSPFSLPQLRTASPEEARQAAPKFAGQLTYPADMKYFAMFAFKTYERVIPTSAPIDKSSITLVLPIPSNLVESFAVDYATPALGPIAGSLADSAISTARELQGAPSTNPDAKQKELVASAASAAVALGLKSVKATSETAGNITAMASGVAPNPHLAVIFQNIGLREHTFSYKFAPNSAAELATLKRIIKEVKRRMLPGLTKGADVLFTFPDVCDISFGPTKDIPYKIKRCVLTSLNVNYAPNGPAFFKTGDPVMVDISMTFKEMSAFTRNDITE